jgi:hypothetical protein
MRSMAIPDHSMPSANDLLNIVNIEHLGSNQVTKYLKVNEQEIVVKTGLALSEFESFLYKIYDLQDLMQRPLLGRAPGGGVRVVSSDSVGLVLS